MTAICLSCLAEEHDIGLWKLSLSTFVLGPPCSFAGQVTASCSRVRLRVPLREMEHPHREDQAKGPRWSVSFKSLDPTTRIATSLIARGPSQVQLDRENCLIAGERPDFGDQVHIIMPGSFENDNDNDSKKTDSRCLPSFRLG
jgi:hypothetical protein